MATTNQSDPWRLDIHVIQNLIRTGEQGTHWDKTNKNWPTIIFSFSSAAFLALMIGVSLDHVNNYLKNALYTASYSRSKP